VFAPLAVIAFCWTLVVGMKNSPALAVAHGWLPSAILIPVWLASGFGSLTVDLRTAASLAVIVTMALKPSSWSWKWSFADVLAIGLVIAVSFSQHTASGLRPLTVPEIMRIWFLPYLMGRILIGDITEVNQVLKGVTQGLLILSGLAIFECISRINPINTALGRTYGLLEAGEGYRWGMKRAHVTFDHPIFFGMGLVLLIPWTIEASRRAKIGMGPKWWRYLPWAIAIALFATVSRGPQLAGISTACIYAFFRYKVIRIPVAIIAITLGVVVYSAKDQVVDLLAVVAGEKSENEVVRVISIDGEEFEYTGTNHRVLLFKVYKDACDKAGAFGFGSELKGVEVEETIAQRFSSIDCHYLLFYLQYGYLGLCSFILLSVGILFQLFIMAFRSSNSLAYLAAGLAGALCGVSVLLVSVWFSPDFGGIWLFTAGIAARLPQLQEPSISDSKYDSSSLQHTRVSMKFTIRHLTPMRPHAKV
jgi:hypothetical protein